MDPRLRVLVVGCSSGVGLHVTKLLLRESERFEVFGLVRNQEKAANAIGEGSERVNFKHGDVTKKETLEPACQGIDAAVCSVGATEGWRLPGSQSNTPKNVDYLGVKKLSEAAAAAKGENCLREAYRKQEGIAYNIARPGGLTNKEGGKKEIIVDQGDKISGRITRQDVALVVLACLKGKRTPNSTFEIVNGDKEFSDLGSLMNLVPDQL